MAVQRRRRMMLRQNTQNPADTVAAFSRTETVAEVKTVRSASVPNGDLQPIRQQLLRESGGRSDTELRVEITGHEAQIVPLNQPFVLIGRNPSCDIRFDHPGVLPRHLYLQWIDGRLFCCTLGMPSQKSPAVGIWIGEEPVTVGPFQLSVIDSESLPSLAPESLPSRNSDDPQVDFDPLGKSAELASDVPQVQLTFTGVEQSDNFWPVDRPLTLIGCGSQCKLRLDHADIPTVLAALYRTPTSLWLINLADEESLRVNEQSTLLQSLDFGDLVQLGPFQAEVSAASLSLKTLRTAAIEDSPKPARSSVKELTNRHRERLGTLTKSLAAVQLYLDAEHLDSVPELKSSLQRYVLQAQRHHREMQEALDQLSELTGHQR